MSNEWSVVGQSYQSFIKKNTTNPPFDVIVIGSGTGGLSSASLLAQNGKRVLLLEQHYVFGGYTHAFQRNGYEWDVGLHYVGQVHIPGSFLHSVFRYITGNKLQWEPLDDVYDRILFGDKEYTFPRGRENLRAKLKEYFPAQKDVEAIDAYFALLDEVNTVGLSYYIEKILPLWMPAFIGNLLRRKLLRYSDTTTLSVLQKLTDNENLIGVLTAQYGDYGLLPSQSSFYMHALLANHYMEGAGYPVGGSRRFAETIIPIIEQAGGVALFRARVEEILVEQNKAVGVRMADGRTFSAKAVVSDAGIVNTYTHLLPQSVTKKHHLQEQVSALEPSAAHMGLYVGIRESTNTLHLPKCNYWIFPNEYNHERGRGQYTNFESQIPVAFASFPSAKDPQFEQRHPGRTTAEVIILLPYEWFSKWEKTAWHKRGEEYEQLKEQIAQHMLELLYRVAPQLTGKVDYYEISSPLSTKHFSAHPHGEIYGAAHTPQRFRQRFLKPITPVKGLYLTGQDVMTASIAGGVMGGVLCASALLKKNLLWNIQRSAKRNV